MKIDLNINLFNSQKAGIFSTQEHVQRLPKKDK